MRDEYYKEERMGRKTWVFILQLIIIWVILLPAQNLNEIFITANQAYRSQEYKRAIELYQQILSQGYESAEIYYNLGNCYYRLDQIGQAILYYEKALRLDPNDEDIKYNLEIANLRVVDRIKLPPRFFLFDWWDDVKFFFSLKDLIYMISISFFLVSVFFICWLFIRNYRIRRFFLTLSILAVILIVFWGYVYYLRIDEYKHHHQGIILAPSVTVLSAPDENSTDVFILHEGVKVDLDEQRQDWVKIRLADGKTGWVKSNVLGVI